MGLKDKISTSTKKSKSASKKTISSVKSGAKKASGSPTSKSFTVKNTAGKGERSHNEPVSDYDSDTARNDKYVQDDFIDDGSDCEYEDEDFSPGASEPDDDFNEEIRDEELAGFSDEVKGSLKAQGREKKGSGDSTLSSSSAAKKASTKMSGAKLKASPSSTRKPKGIRVSKLSKAVTAASSKKVASGKSKSTAKNSSNTNKRKTKGLSGLLK